MVFKRLEIHGFKSFADPIVIDFNEHITCIVGPNGSGKSNISDAIRWVLGEQSPKQLRGGRMEEVIFGGSENRRPRGMAEVTLVIDNTTKLLPIDYTEVAVTRRVFRNGESEYLINGNSCRLKDIRELFMDTGIGVDGYSIIGQGKIQDIISNKPESRRQIFEESAGIVSYMSRKTEAERKLETTSTNLDRINDILSELEERVGVLKKESAAAKQYLSLNERYQYLEVNIILKNLEDMQDQNLKLRNDTADVTGRIGLAERNLADAETSVLEEESRIGGLDRRMSDAQSKMPDVVEKISSIRKEAQFNAERVRNLKAECQRIAQEIEENRDKITASEQEYARLKEEQAGILTQCHVAENDLAEKEQRFRQLSKEVGSVSKIVSDGNDRLFELHSLAAAKRSEANSATSMQEALAKREKLLRNESDTIRRGAETFLARLDQAESRRRNAEEEKFRVEKEIVEVRKRMLDVEERRKILEEQVGKAKIETGKMEARLHTIEEMEHNFEGYNNAVRYIMQANMMGIEGVVGDMLETKEGLEVAIETALGNTKQNIVVKDDLSAKRAVNSLKHNRAGRLTFLPVETIEARTAVVSEAVSSDPGYLGLAVDLVKFRERYRNIFRYLLGRTAVVEDLDTAIRLAKDVNTGVRFVTLEGEVVNIGGAITGGRYKTQTANILGRKNEKIRLSTNIETALQEIGKLERERDDCERSISRLQQTGEELAKELKDAEAHLSAVLPEIESYRRRKEEADERISKNNLEVERIAREIAESEASAAILLSDSRQAENEIEKVTREIQAAMEENQLHEEEASRAEAEVAESRITAAEWRTKKESILALLQKAKETFDDLRARTDAGTERLQTLQKDASRLAGGSQDAESQINSLLQEKLAISELIAQLEKEKKEAGQRKEARQEEAKTFRQEIEAYKNQRFQMENKMGRNETQIENLKDKLWDEFEISYAQAADYKQEGFVLSPAVKEARDLRTQLKALGDVNLSSIKEYEKVEERYTFLKEQQTDVNQAAEELKSIITEMDRKITRQFKANFDLIRNSFEVTFSELFGGGHAELRLDDERHLLESGVEIIAQPPGKKLQNINLLSGGEKTMTAIALMFAVLRVRPTPFCILDEIEAALDEANIDRFANYLKEYDRTQFAIITHQKETMLHADALYGVTMAEEGVSKVLSLKLGTAETDNFARTIR